MKYKIRMSAFGLLNLMLFGASIAMLITTGDAWWACLIVASAFLASRNATVQSDKGPCAGTLHMFRNASGFTAAGFEFKTDPETISACDEVTMRVKVDDIE